MVFTDGEALVCELPLAEAIERLLDNDKIKDKWRMLLDGIVDARRRDDLEDAVLNLEAVDDVTVISKILAGEVGRALD